MHTATMTSDTDPTAATAATGEPHDVEAGGQLRLLQGGAARPIERDWLLDERTRRNGRFGVQQIRETLRHRTPPQPIIRSVA